jgi:hypothetical protein
MPEPAMMASVAGRTVAVVGRAKSLIGSGNGAAIDACDVVVRVNWMPPVTGHPEDVGTRTDLLYLCSGCNGQRAAAESLGVPHERVDNQIRKRISKNPKRVRPTTGVVAVFDVLLSGAAKVFAFGFDLYASGYVAHAPAWAGKKIVRWRHDPREDRRLLRSLLSDARFEADAVLREALA